MAQTQNTNLIRIDTILNDLDPPTPADEDDPLLLTKVTGSEALSAPFLYEVTMVRSLDRDRRIPLDPAKLINTVARIGVGLEAQGPTSGATPNRWLLRGGVFQSIESLGIATLQRTRHYRVYRATVVPPFAMMQREIAFRIFENLSPADIIKNMLSSFPHLEFADDVMSRCSFPNLTYCVQFQEDSFQFLSRLMARFGIWYYFEHMVQEATALAADVKNKVPLRCSRMILGGPSQNVQGSLFKPCAWFSSPIVVGGTTPSPNQIASFIVQSQPASQFLRLGDFNPLAPLKPVHGETPIRTEFDLITPKFDAGDSDGSKTRFQQMNFPIPEYNNKDAKTESDLALGNQEAGVTIATGATKNRSFAAGCQFTIGKDDDDPGAAERKYVITLVNLAAYDHTIGANIGTGLAAFAFDWVIEPLEDLVNGVVSLFGSLFGRPKDKVFTAAVNDPNPDFLLAMAGGGLNNIAKNHLQATFQPAKPGATSNTYPGNSSQAAQFSNETYFGAGALAQVASFLPYLFKVLTSAFSDVAGQISGRDCTVSFAAIPAEAPAVPLPTAFRVVARGPHLATVIGPNGALKADGSDATGVYHDSLGRVRIRFPWDRGPPAAADPAGKVAPPAKTRDPLKTADNTCWVRVAQGWAGRAHGLQFLPRIGEEVIVDFLDGDPDRPIVTGRVYNADHSFANLPFPSDGKDPQSVSIPDDYMSKPQPPTSSGFTRSGIKTCTLRNGEEVNSRFHLLRFDDDDSHEQVLLRSQGRLDVTAFGNRYESIHGDRHLTVGGKDPQTGQVSGDSFNKIFHDYNMHIGDPQGGSAYIKIENDYNLNVKKNTNFVLEGDWGTSVKGQATLEADTIVLNAMKNITLQVGSNFVVITPAGVFVQGSMVMINSGGSPAPPGLLAADLPDDPTAADAGDNNS
jgi:uncharacterized protein involved in type VI secretion and phage assembly